MNNPLSLLFKPNDNIIVAYDVYNYSATTLQALNAVEKLPMFFAINPVKADRRGNAEATSMLNFLYESDTIPIEIQHTLIHHINQVVPVRLVTYSGSKSIHYIVSLEVPAITENNTYGLAMYKAIWESIRLEIESIIKAVVDCSIYEYILDLSTKDITRFSRVPGAFRDGKEQKLLFAGSLLSSARLNEILTRWDIKPKTHIALSTEHIPHMTLPEFETLIKQKQYYELRMRLENADLWAAASGLYHLIFRYTLWALDITGVPKETFLSYLHEHTFPAILEAGYPVERIEKGVHHAYSYKDL